MRNGPIVKWRVVAAALSQILGGWLPAGAGVGQTVARRSAVVTTPVTPAGYAFAIWGVIFAAALVFAVFQLRPPRQDAVGRVRIPFALACAANAAWEVYVQFRAIDVVSVAIIAGGLAAALVALARAGPLAERRWTTPGVIVFAATGLMAGWLSVAAFANVAAVLAGEGFGSGPWMPAVLIAAASVLAAIVAWRSPGRIWVALAAGWGLAAVVVRNLAEGGSGVAVWAALAGIATVALSTLLAEFAGRRGGRAR